MITQTISMRNMLIVFLCLSLVILVFVFPFKTRIMGHINLLEMKCYYSVKSWIIKLICGKIEVENGKIKMENEETFLTGSYDNDFVKSIFGELLSRLDVKKVELFFTGGFKENSYYSALLCGTILSMVESMYGYLSLKYDDVKMYKDIKPTFDENNLELTVDLVVSFSIFGIVKSLMQASKNTKKIKEAKNEG